MSTTRYREAFASRLARRAWTIPFVVTMFLLTTALLPLLMLVLLTADWVRWLASRRRFVLARTAFLGWVYAGADVMAVTALLVTWILSGFGLLRRAEQRMALRLQAWWAGYLVWALRSVYRLGLEVEGEEVVSPGPILLMVRHASMLDTLLPNVLVTRRRGIVLRYVLKRELLLDPALDIAGQRLVNYFVDRRGGDSRTEIERVRTLADGLGPAEGVLIYPEGTRFTEQKRSRIIEKARQRDPELAARAESLRNTLPPRLGGSLALLDAVDGDVVVMAHVGLDGLATVQHLLDGTVVGGRIRVRFWRIPREEIPTDEEGRVDWLYGQWRRVDDWIASHRLS